MEAAGGCSMRQNGTNQDEIQGDKVNNYLCSRLLGSQNERREQIAKFPHFLNFNIS